MNRYVVWIMDRERDLAGIYRVAAARCAHEPGLEQFLKQLADQEEAQARLLQELAASGECPPLDELDPLQDTAARNTFTTTLESVGNELDKSDCDRKRIIECIVAIEFSRWRLLRTCLLACAQCGGRDFQRVAAGMERHRTMIAQFLAEEPESECYRHIILDLKPVWIQRVLILDDERTVAMILAAMIKPLGDTVVCSRGHDALKRLRENHFDAVISDFAMPEMNGIEFYHEAVAVDPSLGSRFLFFTGVDDDRLARMVEDHGVMLLSKPSSLQELQGVVARLLGSGA